MKKKVMKESTAWQIGAHTVMIIGSLLAILPFILLVIASFTDNQTALVNGYSFTPEKWSLEAYQYIASEWATIGRAYLMTILVTVIGTALSLVVGNIIIMNISYHKCVRLDIKSFWKEIFKFIPSLIIPILTIIVIRHFVSDNLFSIALGGIIFTVFYAVSMWFLGLNQNEKKLYKK